ncbi:Thiol-disulfide isomerase or thioredoxin [Bryocella elongata]|uniref:Thiol-disulfide isomerase or thioredoxin n=1 Tax=Bryocella elongata TaxID=863522 RepID=A0A1H6B2A3_9BACT|nr:TlpA disulfide reductase family protein [Bryocella elongata]SEG54949.1 Thiol-disulfide isomerase or thioredoxin [Bryocella elongata]
MLRRVLVAGGIALVLAVLVTAGIHNLRDRRAAMQQAAAQHVDLTPVASGDAADAIPPELGRDLRGKAAPDFTLTTLDGRHIQLADLKGKTVIVNFWATYCGPCRVEMPWFEEFGKKYANDKLVVLGLNYEDGVTRDDVAKAVKKTGVTYPILMADDKTAKAFGLGDYLPVTYYVDAKGEVVDQSPGAPTKDQMEATIKKAIARSQS